LFEIDECTAVPQVTLQFVAANDLPGPVRQKRKDLERLAVKPYADPMLAEGSRNLVVFERTEDKSWRLRRLGFHGGLRSYHNPQQLSEIRVEVRFKAK